MATGEVVSGLPTAKGLTARTCTVPEIVSLVESTKWGDSLSAREVETLSRYLHVCDAEKDTVIVREGGREPYLCLLVEGRVKIVKEGTGHASKRIGFVEAGRIVGEMSLIDGEPRSASIIAEEPAILIVLTGEAFSRLSSEVPRLAIKVLLKISKLISQRLRQTSGALVDFLGE
jgi:CRP-like cAMP-binding protein